MVEVSPMRTRLLGLVALLAACPIHRPTPPVLPAPPPPTPAPPSTFQATHTVSFGDLMGSFESSLPGSHPMEGAWTEVDYPFFIKKALTRHPLRLTSSGATLQARIRYDYRLEVARRTKKPWPLSGYVWVVVQRCSGFLDVGLNIHLDLDGRGRVLPDTTVARPEGGGCYSGKLYDRFVVPILARSADVIDARLASITLVADQLDALWRDSAAPLSVGDGFV